MKYVYRVECEWDIGHEYLIFTSKKAALTWINYAWQEGIDMSVEEAFREGLVSIRELVVYA